MQISQSVLASARQKGRKDLHRSAVAGEAFTQPAEVVDQLANATSPAAQPGARQLLQKMAGAPWVVVRGKHPSASDSTQHILVEVADVRYHLRLDGRDCIFDITSMGVEQAERLSGQNPWVGPGS